jgi:hypothetical protein
MSQENEDAAIFWEQLVEDMASGRVSIMDFMKIAHQSGAKQDYFEHVQRVRIFNFLLRDKRIRFKLEEEIASIGEKEIPSFNTDVKKKLRCL